MPITVPHPEKPAIHVKNTSIFLHRTEVSANLAYFPKFGCHGNSLHNLKNSDGIFEFTNPVDPTIHAKNPRFRRLAVVYGFNR